MNNLKIDVCIPVFKPDDKLRRLLEMLYKQSIPVNKIILYNTGEEDFFAWVKTYVPDFKEKYPDIVVHHISPAEFDHGRSRNQARGYCDADTDVIVYMTQDAIPADDEMLSALVKPLTEQQADISYARQLPAIDSDVAECFTRVFNYPEEACVKGKEDLDRLGIKTYFCSNVCAAYKRQTFETYGEFVQKTIFNEDMIFAGKRIYAGDKVAYVAEAKVIHSHNYTGRQQFHRNFDLAVSQAQHPEVFEGVPSEGEGIRMVKATAKYLVRNGYPWKVFMLVYQSGCKYIGYFLGKRYEKLPMWLILKCTSSRKYWKNS